VSPHAVSLPELAGSECAGWPAVGIAGANVGDELAWRALELDEASWQPVPGPWLRGPVAAIDHRRGLVWLGASAAPLQWAALLDPRKAPK
jgi:hypothetical protein